MRPKVLVISLGGTITMTPGDHGGIVPTLTASDLVATVPELDAAADIEAMTAMRKPSASIELDDVLDLAQLLTDRFAGETMGAVVIQGTDTIEETAFLLDRLVGSAKPIVVTGAMRGPREPGADGPRNILSAVLVAASEKARDRGTLVVLNDEIHAARFVQKAHTALPSAFRSPLGGTVGLVIEGEPRFHLRTDRAPTLPGPFSPTAAPVALLTMALGDDGRLLTALPTLGYAGAVIEGMGAGHVPAALAPIVSDLLAVMPLVLASRADTGPVFARTYGYPGSEIDLLGRGCLSAGLLSGVKARLLLTLLLRSGASPEGLADTFAACA